MAREYIDELGDGTINPETSGVDSQATDNGTHVKTLAPIYYTPATIANDGKATRETPATIKSALDGKQNTLATQTAYSEKGTATKVPQITTNSLGQVTGITEVTISGVTPSSHASTATTYGIGTTSNYGHVKLATGDMNGATNTDGVAVSKNHTHSQYAPKASPALTGTPTAPTAADGTNTTQIATTAFVQSAVTQGLSVSDAMVYKGTITLGATSPGGLTVAADKGHTYKVVANGNTKEGYVDGVKVEAGDMVICNTDSTAAATSSNYSAIAAKWDFVQGNTDGVVVGPASATSGNVVVFDGSTGKLVKDGGTLGTAAFKDVASSGNASTTQVVMGNDTRLTDSRTPTSHTHGNISNDGAITSTTQSSDITIATGDKLLVTDSSNSNKVVRTGTSFDTGVTTTYLCRNGTFATVKEADVAFGGTFKTYKSPTEAFTLQNVWFGPKPSAIVIEYSNNRTDANPTWTDYGLTDAQIGTLFSGTDFGVNIKCGKAIHVHPGYTGSATYKDLSNDNIADQGLRITVCCRNYSSRSADFDNWVYCNLRRIFLRMSTQSAGNGAHCVVESLSGANFKSNTDTWNNLGDYKIQGDSGWNSIPYNANFGGGWSQTDIAWAIRFTIWSDTLSASPNSGQTGCMAIYSIAAISDNVWTANGAKPSMQRYGTPYVIGGDGKATFADIQFTGRKLAVSLSNTSTDTSFNGSADVTNIKTTGTLPVANGGTGKTTVTSGNYLVGNGTGALTEKTPNAVGNNVLTSLATGDDNLIEGDYIIASNHTSGSTDTTKFVRRTTARLWNYIKSQISSVLGLTATTYGGNAATATKATQDSDGNVINTTYLKELYQAEYGVSTFADIYAAVMAKKTVYCKVPGGSGGNGARMAFLAYTNVSNPPTSSSNIEFQYYRSNSSGTGDSVFVYTITNNNNTWTTVERAASSSVKGNAESTYRTGQVNLTPANLGISATTSSVTVGSTTFNKYTHPTTSGNKHVPSGGSSGQFLGWDSDGTAKWVANPNTDTKVKATAKSDNANYKILATASASPTSGAATEAVYDTDITLNPSTNTITANVSGNAATATSANITRTADTTNGDKLQIGSGTAVNVVNSKSTLNVAASAASTNTSARHIWFSDSSTETKRAYSGDLTYRTDTNTISANISGNAATATTATNYNTSSGNINTALNGKSSTSHTHSVSINGSTKTIAASGGTAVDLGTYKVFNYARVYATQTYNANTNRYILLAFRSTTYTHNWEESSMFKLVVNDGQFPKELVFRLWLTGTISDNVVPSDPSNPKLYRVYFENFSTSALNILDVRLFVIEKSAASIRFTIGIFIDRNYLQAQYVSYQLYPLSCSTYDRGNDIDNGLSSWTYTVENNSYYENIMHDNVFTTVFAVNDLTVGMNINGNAATATKATQDADGNNIKNSYMKATSGTKSLAFGSSTQIGTVGGNAVNVSLPSLPTISNRLQVFTGFRVSKPLTENWYDGYGASLLSFFGGSGHIYHIGFRLMGKDSSHTATASNPFIPGTKVYITVDGDPRNFVQELEVYYKVVDTNVEVMVLTPLKDSSTTQRINLMGVITRDYNLTTSNSTIITTLNPSIDGWTRKTTDIVSNRMQTLLPTSGSGSNLKYNINISGTAVAADTAAEAGYATAFNIASATTGNVVDNTLYKIPVLNDNAVGCWTGKPSTSTGTQQRLLYNPNNNTINANITGDAQSVRGFYITKTIVSDTNAIIFF